MELCLQHICWCYGPLHRQVINDHGINFIWYTGPCLPLWWIFTTCSISISRNDRKSKYIFVFKKNQQVKCLFDWRFPSLTMLISRMNEMCHDSLSQPQSESWNIYNICKVYPVKFCIHPLAVLSPWLCYEFLKHPCGLCAGVFRVASLMMIQQSTET